MPRPSNSNRRSIVAVALLAAGVTGTVVDPSGPVGITLFGVAVAAAVYLIGRPVRQVVRRFAATSLRITARPLAGVVRGRTVAAVVTAMSVLFTLWLAIDLARPLVYAFWWGFCFLVAWLVAIAVLITRRSLRTAQ